MVKAQTVAALIAVISVAACSSGGPELSRDNPYAPAVDPDGEAVDGMIVGHRLMEAGEYQLALDAYTRAAGEQGLTAEVLTSLGSVNLQLGRLNQAEKYLRAAIEADATWPEAWNNLGVVLMEQGKTGEAVQVFRQAYALDNGESDSIRDNLRLALAKLENTVYDQGEAFQLVRRGRGNYLITAKED
jgi:Flp pilus assembly protein TadD